MRNSLLSKVRLFQSISNNILKQFYSQKKQVDKTTQLCKMFSFIGNKPRYTTTCNTHVNPSTQHKLQIPTNAHHKLPTSPIKYNYFQSQHLPHSSALSQTKSKRHPHTITPLKHQNTPFHPIQPHCHVPSKKTKLIKHFSTLLNPPHPILLSPPTRYIPFQLFELPVGYKRQIVETEGIVVCLRSSWTRTAIFSLLPTHVKSMGCVLMGHKEQMHYSHGICVTFAHLMS